MMIFEHIDVEACEVLNIQKTANNYFGSRVSSISPDFFFF